MTTKRNTTMIAPAYTSTWITPMKCASSMHVDAPPEQNIVFTSQSAAATGLFRVTNASADAIASRPKR